MSFSEQQIKHMVDRFLGWRLPGDFRPDGGVQFDADAAKKLDPRNLRYEPYGTNLLDATQAAAMVRQMIDGLPENQIGAAEREVGRWVYRRIEALMDARAGSPEGDELQYLAAAASCVEEYGEEACGGTELAPFPSPRDMTEPNYKALYTELKGEVLEKVGAFSRLGELIGQYQDYRKGRGLVPAEVNSFGEAFRALSTLYDKLSSIEEFPELPSGDVSTHAAGEAEGSGASRQIERLERRLRLSREGWLRAAEAALATVPGASNSTHAAYDLWLRVEMAKAGPAEIVLSTDPNPSARGEL